MVVPVYPPTALDTGYYLRNLDSGFRRRYRILEDGNFPRCVTCRALSLVADLFLGLDDLSHHLQEEGSYGYGVIFLLIWITTFRKSRVIRRANFFRSSSSHSAVATVLHLHHTLWLHLRGMDGSCCLLLRCALWSRVRLRPLSDVFPRDDHVLAFENHVDQEGRPCDREAAETSVYGSPRPLPL